jgi:hypothetical protein
VPSRSPMPGTSDPCPPRPNPLAGHPTQLPVYACLCMFIFPHIPFRGVVTGHSCHHVWLVVLDVCRTLSVDSLSYGRHFHCAQGPASLCMSVPVCFLSSSCGGGVMACVWQLQFFCKCLHLPRCLAADLKLVWTDRPDKPGVGVT